MPTGNVDQILTYPPALRAEGETRPAGGTQPKRKHKAHGGRFEVLNSFVDASMADLCRSEMAVWLVLYRDTRKGTARTSYADIARRAGVSTRTAGRALRALERCGLVRVVHRGGLNTGASRYAVRGVKP